MKKTLDRDIKIWFSYHYLKVPIWDLEKKYKIKKQAVKSAIERVSKKFLELPNEILLKGSIYAIRERIRILTNLLESEIKKPRPSIRNVKELNAEIRQDSIELQKLEQIYRENFKVEIEGSESIKQILSLITKEQKNK